MSNIYNRIATLTAQGEHTKNLIPVVTSRYQKLINISIEGTFEGTVALQRQFKEESGDTWHYTGDSWTSSTQKAFPVTEPGIKYRLILKIHVSGSAIARISY